MALAKQAFNPVDDLRGQRTAMDAIFHMHHQPVSGDLIGGTRRKIPTEPRR